MLNITPRTTLLLACAALFAACGRDRSNDNGASAAGALDTSALDTASLRTSGATPATGPGIHVTRTDAKSVTRAMRYELTPGNFSHFLAAADSVVALLAAAPPAADRLRRIEGGDGHEIDLRGRKRGAVQAGFDRPGGETDFELAAGEALLVDGEAKPAALQQGGA